MNLLTASLVLNSNGPSNTIPPPYPKYQYMERRLLQFDIRAHFCVKHLLADKVYYGMVERVSATASAITS